MGDTDRLVPGQRSAAAAAVAAVELRLPAAVDGDRAALEEVLRAVQRDVYNLAVRMLWSPEDAADATQDVLIKVVTHLATFRGDSSFRTWVWRIATRHLLAVRKSALERERVTFARFGAELATGLSEPPAGAESDPEQVLLEEEVKLGCTQGMLLCLDREHRVAYVLGEVFELSSDEAAEVLGIPAATYRKRLSRARERIRAFMRGHCGLIDPDRPCRCARRVAGAVASGCVRPGALLFAGQGPARVPPRQDAREEVAQMEDLHRIAAVYRSSPDYVVPDRVLGGIRRLLDAGEHSLLR